MHDGVQDPPLAETPVNPPHPPQQVLLLLTPDRVIANAPAGWMDAATRAALREALHTIRPTLARVGSPPLPPRDQWPEGWREAWEERAAIAADGGAPDPEAVADLDLRVMVARHEFDPDPSSLARDPNRSAP